MARVDVTTEIVIQCPREQVASFAANPSNVPEWYEKIKSVEWKTEPVVRVGSRIAFVAHFLGRRLAYTYEIVEYSPGEKLVMSTTEGPFPMETSYLWESVAANATRMTLRNQGNPTGFSILMTPLMSWMIRKQTSKDLKKLQSLLESRPKP